MNLDELTLGQIKEINKLTTNQDNQPHPFLVGEKYFIRTVTMALTGKLTWVGQQELVLTEAAWIADTGRFHNSMKDQNNFGEVEPFVNDVILGRGAIIDCTKIDTLPRVQKWTRLF